MKKAFLIWIFCLNLSIAQVNGISGAKLSVPDALRIKVNKILLSVLGSQFDIKGSNTDKSWGYFAAFTFAFE